MKQLIGLCVVLALVGCSKTDQSKRISIDGSSTVFPLSEAVVEAAAHDSQLKDLRVGVALSGTGGGFKKFCNGEIEITGASRPIKESEIEMCTKGNVSYIELPLAYDGLAVVVNNDNPCAGSLTTAQLKKIWEPAAEGKITNWNQVDPSCPDMALSLYGPGHDSGTFDYFTEEVVGTSKSSRSDFTASEDDNVIVTGVAGDKGGMAYFGYAYYAANKDKLKLVAVDSGSGPVAPDATTIANGTYTPLSRPLFIYVSAEALKNPRVESFVSFFIDKSGEMAEKVGYVALGHNPSENEKLYNLVSQILENRKTGKVFSQTSTDLSLEERLKKSL